MSSSPTPPSRQRRNASSAQAQTSSNRAQRRASRPGSALGGVAPVVFRVRVGRSSNSVGHHRTFDAAALQSCKPCSNGANPGGKILPRETLALSGCPRLRTISRVLPSHSATRVPGRWSNKRAKDPEWKRPNSAAFIRRTEKQKQGSESNTASSAVGSGMKERGQRDQRGTGGDGAPGFLCCGTYGCLRPRRARCVPDSDLLHHANSLWPFDFSALLPTASENFSDNPHTLRNHSLGFPRRTRNTSPT